MGTSRLLAVATWTEMHEASMRDGTKLPHKLGAECGKALQDNISYLVGLRDQAQSRIAELEAEVADLKLQLGMCDHSLHAAWNDAIEAAALAANDYEHYELEEVIRALRR